jgi:hypothetical protein
MAPGVVDLPLQTVPQTLHRREVQSVVVAVRTGGELRHRPKPRIGEPLQLGDRSSVRHLWTSRKLSDELAGLETSWGQQQPQLWPRIARRPSSIRMGMAAKSGDGICPCDLARPFSPRTVSWIAPDRRSRDYPFIHRARTGTPIGQEIARSPLGPEFWTLADFRRPIRAADNLDYFRIADDSHRILEAECGEGLLPLEAVASQLHSVLSIEVPIVVDVLAPPCPVQLDRSRPRWRHEA